MNQQIDSPARIDDALKLADLLRPSWGPMQHALRLSGVPLNDGDEGGEGTISKEKADELSRAIAEKDREVRDLKKEKKDQDDRLTKLEEQLEDAKGDGNETAKLERKIERLEGKLEDEESTRKEVEADLSTTKQETMALRVAGRLKFRNPGRAVKLLDSADLESEDSAERALEKLAREEPYMVTKAQRDVTGKDGGDGGGEDGDRGNDGGGQNGGEGGGSGNGNGGGSGDDEVKGTARLRQHYAKADSGDGGSGGGGSD